MYYHYHFYSGEEPSNLGGRFSKSSAERELILQRRKEHMRLTARRRYLEKHRKSEIDSTNLQLTNTENVENTTS